MVSPIYDNMMLHTNSKFRASYQIKTRPFISVFVHLAMSLTSELGLTRSVALTDSEMIPCLKFDYAKPSTPRTMEERRAVLGCYLFSSMYAPEQNMHKILAH